MSKEKISFEEQMWINNCYRCGGWPGSVHQPDPECHVCQLDITPKEAKECIITMNHAVYQNVSDTT